MRHPIPIATVLANAADKGLPRHQDRMNNYTTCYLTAINSRNTEGIKDIIGGARKKRKIWPHILRAAVTPLNQNIIISIV